MQKAAIIEELRTEYLGELALLDTLPERQGKKQADWPTILEKADRICQVLLESTPARSRCHTSVCA